jgi:tRNA/rRNA methyltransferase
VTLPEGFSVTLMEPKYPVNVGHVARLVRNFGVRRLYLVKPKVDMSVAAIYASHASDVLDEATVAPFAQVRRENEILVATTAVRASKYSNLGRRSVGPDRLRALLSSSKSSSLVFGRDSTGLTNEEIMACDATVTIETSAEYRALNVGHAAAILLYVASRRGSEPGRVHSRVARELFAASLAELGELSEAPAHKAGRLFETGKRIAASSALTDRQLNLITGILRRASVKMGRDQDFSKT